MWLYVPPTQSMSSPSAPGAADSISVSSWQFQALAASAWSRGKHSPPRNWYQRWKRATWLQRLYGAMPEPSTAERGVAAWTASLAASRASLTASPASDLSGKTSATSGQQLGASSSSLARGSSSSKTSAAWSRRAGQSAFGETFADLASRLSADYFLRQKSGRRMSANASSSSLWLTPDMPSGGRSLPQGTTSTGIKPDGTKAQIGLENQARWRRPGRRQQPGNHKGANQQDMHDRGTKGPPLNEMAALWSTPRASDGEKGGPNMSFGAGGVPLPAQTSQWPTPTALNRPREEATIEKSLAYRNAKAGQTTVPLYLEEVAVREACFRQGQTIPASGAVPSNSGRSLNPLFVEWLMGWPPGWTLLAWTDFACSATALSLWRQDMQFALSQLASPQEAPPAQLSLLG